MSKEISISDAFNLGDPLEKLLGDLEAKEFEKIRGGVQRNPLIVEQPVDIVTFAESPEFLNLKLKPRQRLVLKIFYGLKLDYQDFKELIWLEVNKGIRIPLDQMIPFGELVLVIGRRGGKTFMVSVIAAYEAYKLINKYDPQMYYGLPPDEEIYILNAATAEPQALVMFAAIKSRIKNCKWFDPYIAGDFSGTMRLFTKKDIEDNQKIRAFNEVQKYHVDKRKEKPGSIVIMSTHSNSRSIRGKGAIIVVFDELAHFLDNQGNQSGSVVYEAITPSVKTFKKNGIIEGKIVSISSPWGKSGKFYELYETGNEYDKNGKKKFPEIVVFQYASWEFNDTFVKDDFKSDYMKNPASARTEFGGEFADVVDAAFNPMHIDRMVNANRRKIWVGQPGIQYMMTLDPAKNGDVFASAWGHLEEYWEEIEDERGVSRKIKRQKVVIDGVYGWRSQIVEDPTTGEIYKKEIDFIEIEEFINDMSVNMTIDMVGFDQFSSVQMIQQLKKKGFTAFETPFTNKYKRQIYENFGELLAEGRVEIFGKEDTPDDWYLNQAVTELKFIQRLVKGKIVSFTHPDSGPVQNDDFADCIVNLAWLLLSGGAASVVQRNNRGPLPGKIRPVKANGLNNRAGWGGAAVGFNNSNAYNGKIVPIDRLKGR